ncbi:MAG: hypothetical protein RL577_254 [Bacteroidota bacterium]|jgi:hypothetical protein
MAACDACGCRPGTYAWGQMSSLTSNFFSINSYKRAWNHDQGSDLAFETTLNYTCGKKTRWSFQVPIQTIFKKGSYEETFYNTSIGDAQINCWIPVADFRNRPTDEIRGLIMAGSALRLPTGKYMVRGADKDMLGTYLQPGLGSYGFTIHSYGSVMLRRFGAWFQASSTQYFQNELGQTPGNQFQLQSHLYREIPLKKNLLMPQLGIAYNYQNKNTVFGYPDEGSGGHLFSLQTSISLFGAKGYWQALAQLPYLQEVPVGAPIQIVSFGVSWGHFIP